MSLPPCVKRTKRLANGTYLLWYPVITRQRVTTLLRDLQQSGIPDILQLELCISADHDGLGMTGSGLFIINPPWTLAANACIITVATTTVSAS